MAGNTPVVVVVYKGENISPSAVEEALEVLGKEAGPEKKNCCESERGFSLIQEEGINQRSKEILHRYRIG